MNLTPLLFCLPILLICCQGPAQTPPPSSLIEKPVLPNRDFIRADSIANSFRLRDIQDSLWLKKLEVEVFEKVSTFKSRKTARFECDSFHFEKGNLVRPGMTHLLVYLRGRDGYFGEYSIWELQGDYWALLLNVGSGISTQGVLFKDVNGDGYKDFLMECFAQAGTGEKNYNEVYLYNPRNHAFDYIDGLGMNPHFYPKTRIVTCYYNPAGGWSAEKYRLNWNQLELLEEIEIRLLGMVEGTEDMDCIRKIYRFRKGEKYLFKQDRICGFPPEYKAYEELIKTPD